MASIDIDYFKDVLLVGMNVVTKDGFSGIIEKKARVYLTINGRKIRYEDVILPSIDDMIGCYEGSDPDVIIERADVSFNGFNCTMLKLLSKHLRYDNRFFIDLANLSPTLLKRLYDAIKDIGYWRYTLSFHPCETKKIFMTCKHRSYVCVEEIKKPPNPTNFLDFKSAANSIVSHKYNLNDFDEFCNAMRLVGRFALEESGVLPVFKSKYSKSIVCSLTPKSIVKLEGDNASVVDKIARAVY